MSMTASEARAIVVMDTAAGTYPQITNSDVDAILLRCRVVDSAGRIISDPDWVGTYDLNLACALVFEAKASRVADQVDFSRDGASFRASQRAEGFMQRAKEYRKRRAAGFGFEPDVPEVPS